MRQTLILASGSPRRRELLTRMGINFTVCVSDADECLTGAPDEVVRELSARKARSVYAAHPGETVLAADTLVYCAGRILGKPLDAADAMRMLMLLSGKTHEVYTGVCLIDGKTGTENTRCACTKVRFAAIDEQDARRYIASGEPMDKAGAYAVQGMGGMFVEAVEGSPSNVVGLPLHTVREMLLDIGWQL